MAPKKKKSKKKSEEKVDKKATKKNKKKSVEEPVEKKPTKKKKSSKKDAVKAKADKKASKKKGDKGKKGAALLAKALRAHSSAIKKKLKSKQDPRPGGKLPKAEEGEYTVEIIGARASAYTDKKTKQAEILVGIQYKTEAEKPTKHEDVLCITRDNGFDLNTLRDMFDMIGVTDHKTLPEIIENLKELVGKTAEINCVPNGQYINTYWNTIYDAVGDDSTADDDVDEIEDDDEESDEEEEEESEEDEDDSDEEDEEEEEDEDSDDEESDDDEEEEEDDEEEEDEDDTEEDDDLAELDALMKDLG